VGPSEGTGASPSPLVTLAADVVLVVWVNHRVRESTRTDLFVPIGEVPQPTFPDPSQAQIYGSPDPNWSFRSLAGKSVKLANFRGRVVFLHFWATWCGGCREELPYLRWLQDRTRNLPVSIVLLSEENPEKVEKYLAGFHFSSLPAYVATEKSPPVFQIFELPSTFIINRDGRVVYRYVGAAPWGDKCVKFLSDLAAEGSTGGD
jgi:thiol-disulfide isomerase/thioredoxin